MMFVEIATILKSDYHKTITLFTICKPKNP